MGYFYAILSSLFFTMYAIPKKFSKLKPVYYVLFMGISCLFISLLFYIFIGLKESLFNKYLILSFIGGISWFIASALFFLCVDKIGVARSTQFKSLQGPFGSIMILFVLSEYNSLNVYILIIAILFIFLACLMLVVKDNDNEKLNKWYLLCAVLSAFLYGLAGFFRKMVTLQGLVHSQQIYSALGIVLGSIIYILLCDNKIVIKKENTKKYFLALLSGFFYYFASYFMLKAYEHIEGSVAFSIIQLNALWAGIIGIFIFKEINYKRHLKNIILALAFSFLAVSLLVIS